MDDKKTSSLRNKIFGDILLVMVEEQFIDILFRNEQGTGIKSLHNFWYPNLPNIYCWNCIHLSNYKKEVLFYFQKYLCQFLSTNELSYLTNQLLDLQLPKSLSS